MIVKIYGIEYRLARCCADTYPEICDVNVLTASLDVRDVVQVKQYVIGGTYGIHFDIVQNGVSKDLNFTEEQFESLQIFKEDL